MILLKIISLTIAIWMFYVTLVRALRGQKVSAVNFFSVGLSTAIFMYLMGWLT